MDSFVTTFINTKCDHFNIIGEQIVELLLHMQFPIFVLNFVLRPAILLSMLFWITPNGILSLGRDTKYHTHKKRNLNFSFFPTNHIFYIKNAFVVIHVCCI
jgi:hypothetical protein